MTRSQTRRKIQRQATLDSGTPVDCQVRIQLLNPLQAARQRQTEEQQMAVAPMLLQYGFMISHSQACCSPWGFIHAPAIVRQPG